MDNSRFTDERLRTFLNGNQPARERMCLAILSRDRNYTDVRPRRPEGGPDGGRDIECLRAARRCYGAVGFVNSATDSQNDKRQIKKKFKDDLKAALDAAPDLEAFVFFTNVDLTPAELGELQVIGTSKKITFVDIYHRERIRMALDNPEMLGIRYQYLALSLTESEQAAFFSRFGNDLEQLVRGRMESIERKIDQFEYNLWQGGTIRSLSLELQFREYGHQRRKTAEHFRVCVELQSIGAKRDILFGGRDDYWFSHDGGIYWGTRPILWREFATREENEHKWGRIADAGTITTIRFAVGWLRSNILAGEFQNLSPQLYVTENLVNQLASVKCTINSYILLEEKLEPEQWQPGKLLNSWPESLTPEEEAIAWRRYNGHFWGLDFRFLPPKDEDR